MTRINYLKGWKKRGILKILICSFILVIICGCGFIEYELLEKVEATVVDKEYREAYTTIFPMTISNGETVTTTFIPQQHPEKYRVKVQYKEKKD